MKIITLTVPVKVDDDSRDQNEVVDQIGNAIRSAVDGPGQTVQAITVADFGSGEVEG